MTYSFRTNGNFIDFVHTDNTSLEVESVLRSLHNTSRCITWSLPEDTDRISFVVDDIRVDNFPLSEIDFDGTAINSQDDFETGIIAAFPGLAGGGSPSPSTSYLVYTALLSQSGTNAPVPVVLQNTLGGTVVWTRNDVGDYSGTLTGVFTENKTWAMVIPFANNNMELGPQDINTMYLQTKETGAAADDQMYLTPIEIRVYS